MHARLHGQKILTFFIFLNAFGILFYAQNMHICKIFALADPHHDADQRDASHFLLFTYTRQSDLCVGGKDKLSNLACMI